MRGPWQPWICENPGPFALRVSPPRTLRVRSGLHRRCAGVRVRAGTVGDPRARVSSEKRGARARSTTVEAVGVGVVAAWVGDGWEGAKGVVEAVRGGEGEGASSDGGGGEASAVMRCVFGDVFMGYAPDARRAASGCAHGEPRGAGRHAARAPPHHAGG